jgi:Carboxypeptidase regulatory-like domain
VLRHPHRVLLRGGEVRTRLAKTSHAAGARRIVRVALLPACATLLLQCPAPGLADQGLNGQVVGADGQPKRFALVQLQGPGQYTVMTGQDGMFSLPAFTPGSYTITVRQDQNVQAQRIDISGYRVSVRVKW